MAQDAPPIVAADPYTEESMQQAIARFVVIQDELEAKYMKQYVRIDPDTGDYAVGKTRGEARAVFRTTYGGSVAWTMHIGTTRER
jgi:hypothetical protein